MDTLAIRSPTAMPPLLQRLTERKPENLDYLGVSYGLTSQLLRSACYQLKYLTFLTSLTGSGSARATSHCTSVRHRANLPASTRLLWSVDSNPQQMKSLGG